ncbi:MAG: ABC transporter permease [Ilumatobacteraceae bacterium]
MGRSALARPLPWLAVLVGIVLAGVMTFAYVGAFVDPVGELADLPVGIVDLDQPTEVAGQQLAVGQQFVGLLTGPGNTGAVEFEVFESREDAVAAIMDNELAGALIVPAGLSQQVGAIGTALGNAPQATIEVIRNPGAGSFQPAVVDAAAADAIDGLNAAVSSSIGTALTAAGASIAPASARAVAVPILQQPTDIPVLSTSGGRGLPPLYVAVMTTLTGLVGAIAIHIAVGSVAGRDRLEALGHELVVRRVPLGSTARFWQEAALVGVLAIGSAFVIPWMAIGVLGAQADRPWSTVPICGLGVLAIGWLTLLCVTAFGVAGEVLVVLITTIFGVPSARGVYPAEALPTFFDALGSFLPLRFLTDALRSLFFFEGRSAAGLGTGVAVLWTWALGSLLLGALAARVIGRNEVLDEDGRVALPAAPS